MGAKNQQNPNVGNQNFQPGVSKMSKIGNTQNFQQSLPTQQQEPHADTSAQPATNAPVKIMRTKNKPQLTTTNPTSVATKAQPTTQQRSVTGVQPSYRPACNAPVPSDLQTKSNIDNNNSSVKIEARNLHKEQSEWEAADYAYFTQEFNRSEYLHSVKNLVGKQRIKDIESLVLKCIMDNLPIDMGKAKKFFSKNAERRWCSRVLTVTKDCCLRVSDKLAAQHGLKLYQGQKFEFSYVILPDGKKEIILTMLA